MINLLMPRKSARTSAASAFLTRTADRIAGVVAEFRAAPVVQQSTQPAAAEVVTETIADADVPDLDLIEGAAREYERAAEQARRADRGKRAARKVLGRVPSGRWGGWLVERVESTRQTADLDQIRATYKALGLGPVPMKPNAPSLKIERATVGDCATCGEEWPLDQLGTDANGDAECPDCASTHAGEAEQDAAAYRSYSFAGR